MRLASVAIFAGAASVGLARPCFECVLLRLSQHDLNADMISKSFAAVPYMMSIRAPNMFLSSSSLPFDSQKLLPHRSRANSSVRHALVAALRYR